MTTSAESASDIQSELIRRQRATALTVRVLLALTVGLSLFAFLARGHFRQAENEALDRALRGAILICGIGSVILRRRKFAAPRLHRIMEQNGAAGLLATLASTSLQVSFLGMALAVFGFVATVLTGNDFYSFGAGLVGFVMLVYGYPSRTSWQQIVQKFGSSSAGATAPPLL